MSRCPRVAAIDLIITGRCTGQCLTAYDDECDCRCRGKFHGVLLNAPVHEDRSRWPAIIEPLPETDATAAWLAGGIRAAREAQGLSLRKLSIQARVDRSQLRRIEQGSSELSLTALVRLAGPLGIPVLAKLLAPAVPAERIEDAS